MVMSNATNYPIQPIREPQFQAAEIFAALQACIQGNQYSRNGLEQRVQFILHEPESYWVVDFAQATIVEGQHETAVTISMSHANLGELVRGILEIYDLYEHGQLRVDGDFGFAHNLQFLTALLQC